MRKLLLLLLVTASLFVYSKKNKFEYKVTLVMNDGDSVKINSYIDVEKNGLPFVLNDCEKIYAYQTKLLILSDEDGVNYYGTSSDSLWKFYLTDGDVKMYTLLPGASGIRNYWFEVKGEDFRYKRSKLNEVFGDKKQNNYWAKHKRARNTSQTILVSGVLTSLTIFAAPITTVGGLFISSGSVLYNKKIDNYLFKAIEKHNS